MSTAPFYLSIALPVPLNKCFDYIPLENTHIDSYQAGLRVSVPFGNRQLTGVIVDIHQSPSYDPAKLKAIGHLIDSRPLLGQNLYKLGHWLHQYYHQPLGECLDLLWPVLLRKGQTAQASTQTHVSLASLPNKDELTQQLKRAPRQLALIEHLQTSNEHGQWQKELVQEGFTPAIIKGLAEKGFLKLADKASFQAIQGTAQQNPLNMNDEQTIAVNAIHDAKGFESFLLEGITGSGKTEVYLQSIAPFIEQGKQVLILVPEIGLTPQTVKRFTQRFDADILLLHSQLNDRERLDAWLMAAHHSLHTTQEHPEKSKAQIIIGTRSAIFTPMANLACIIIDEEHDQSFKQQDGIRYHGRDVAVYRAKQENIPIILGSATPSLDSLHNALSNKYKHLRLLQRAGDAKAPTLKILNVKKQPIQHGLADELLPQINQTLLAGNQVLVFVNRRGFAPTLYCPDCAWIAECKSCDAKMTLHQKPAHLHCHHCDAKQALPRQCPECLSLDIQAMGAGTERLESHLTYQFQQTPVIRIDRDSTQNKNAMETLLEPVHAGQPCILVGTQMLAKGHHFPKVTLVIMINVDSGFFSADFRAMEKTAQLILQVAGRAGREKDAGTAVIQTEFADHPLLHLLSEENYHALSLALLEERKQHNLPPYGFQALLRADSTQPKEAEQFLHRVRELLEWHKRNLNLPHINVLGPLPSAMELRAGRFRSQLWINCANRKMLHHFMQQALDGVYEIKGFHKVRWSLDVDPSDNL
jgi:primosomal protein N' (replication factor Y)